jgi:hypothetical protein
MKKMIKSAAMRAYQRGIAATMSVYVVVIVGLGIFLRHRHPQGLLAYGLAILPSIPILGMLAVVGVYLRDEKDEFLRWRMIKALLWATGMTLAVTTVVGFLQNFAAMQAPPAYWVFVMYWLIFGLAQAMLSSSDREQR